MEKLESKTGCVMYPHLFFVGLRASGKTSLGKQLAHELGWCFTDTDEFIAAGQQKTIAEMVECDGWAAFRKVEEEALSYLVNRQEPLVIATGGGMVLSPMNRKILQGQGLCFYLNVPPAELAMRRRKDPLSAQRPAFAQESLLEEAQRLFLERDELYRESCHFVLDGTQPFNVLISQIKATLYNRREVL